MSIDLRPASPHEHITAGALRADTSAVDDLGRTHFTVGQEGWDDVADYALDWAVKAASQPRAETKVAS